MGKKGNKTNGKREKGKKGKTKNKIGYYSIDEII